MDRPYNNEHPSAYRLEKPANNRSPIVRALVLGDYYMRRIYGDSSPEAAASLALHEVVLGTLSKRRSKPLRQALEEFAGALEPEPVTPTVRLLINTHSSDGTPQTHHGIQLVTAIDFPIPTRFAESALNSGCSYDYASVLRTNSQPFPSFPKDHIDDFTRLVAHTMSRSYDYGSTKNWVSSERVVQAVLAERALRFPRLG